MVRVVGTLTTLPGRYETLLLTLKSLKKQSYKLSTIYLTLPEKASRLGLTYEKVPEEIQELCEIVRPPIDYGPITKLYGGLVKEQDPETLIISFDDDVLYDSKTVEMLMFYNEDHPNTTLTGTGALFSKGMLMASIYNNIDCVAKFNPLSGFNIPKNLRKVDVIYGCAGVLYYRKFFPKNEYLEAELFNHALADRDIFLNDDILISAFLCKNKIDRLVCPDIPKIQRIENEEHNALSVDFFRVYSTIESSIKKLTDRGWFCKFEYLGVEETAVTKFGVIVLLLIAIFVAVWFDMIMM
jgi:hypothetical protein